MITNGTATPENYYRIKFANVPHDFFEYGETALSAIRTAGENYSSDPWTLGNATARPAVYGEWDCGTHHFHNDGTHSHDYGMER
jgi:hypothetical protein